MYVSRKLSSLISLSIQLRVEKEKVKKEASKKNRKWHIKVFECMKREG